MYRSLITAVTLLSIVSAEAFAATSPSTPVRAAHTMTQVAQSNPSGKHTVALHSVKLHKIAKATIDRSRALKAAVKSIPSKPAG